MASPTHPGRATLGSGVPGGGGWGRKPVAASPEAHSERVGGGAGLLAGAVPPAGPACQSRLPVPASRRGPRPLSWPCLRRFLFFSLLLLSLFPPPPPLIFCKRPAETLLGHQRNEQLVQQRRPPLGEGNPKQPREATQPRTRPSSATSLQDRADSLGPSAHREASSRQHSPRAALPHPAGREAVPSPWMAAPLSGGPGHHPRSVTLPRPRPWRLICNP